MTSASIWSLSAAKVTHAEARTRRGTTEAPAIWCVEIKALITLITVVALITLITLITHLKVLQHTDHRRMNLILY